MRVWAQYSLEKHHTKQESYTSKIVISEEQDSHEALNAILTTIEEEIKE